MFASAEKQHVNGKARSIHRTAGKAARHIEENAEDTISTIYDAAAAIKEDVESLAHSAGRRVREAIDEAQSNATEVADNMTATIREKPLQAGLIALGIGVLLGFMIRR